MMTVQNATGNYTTKSETLKVIFTTTQPTTTKATTTSLESEDSNGNGTDVIIELNESTPIEARVSNAMMVGWSHHGRVNVFMQKIQSKFNILVFIQQFYCMGAEESCPAHKPSVSQEGKDTVCVAKAVAEESRTLKSPVQWDVIGGCAAGGGVILILGKN